MNSVPIINMLMYLMHISQENCLLNQFERKFYFIFGLLKETDTTRMQTKLIT